MENVWDYPRPPALVPCERRARVELGGVRIADLDARAAGAGDEPPADDLHPARRTSRPGVLRPVERASFCEWKGRAAYFDVAAGGRRAAARGLALPRPSAPYAALAGHVSFYPGRMDGAWLDDERVLAQPGRLLRRLDHG